MIRRDKLVAKLDQVSQLSHVAWGALAVVVPALFNPRLMVWCALVWVAFAAVKEFWYDERYEDPDVRGSGLKDFSFQALGALFGVAVMEAVWHVVSR